MPRIPRFRRKQDPRRPPQTGDAAAVEEPNRPARSYGQWAEPDDATEELKEFEETTDEVAREENGDQVDGQERAADVIPQADIEEREDFEDLTGEVSREGDEKQ